MEKLKHKKVQFLIVLNLQLNFIATDYSVIMQILSKNMTEGQDEFKKAEVKQEKSPTSPQSK